MYHDESACGVLSFSFVCFFPSSASVVWGVAGSKYCVSHVSLRLLGVWSPLCVVFEWICLVVMTRDLVLVKGSQGGSLPPDAVY